MAILLSGSIAFDTIIQTIGTFRNQDIQEKSDMHLSLFAPQIRKEYGGTAANIGYSLALLGEYPYIIATVGEDSGDYLMRMRDMHIQTELIQMIPATYCAQAYIIRDEGSGQINTFHPGSMSASGEISHGNIAFEYAIISPDSRDGMLRRLTECKNSGVFTIFDPGQALGIFSDEDLKKMTIMADITIMNEPERLQFKEISGEDFVEICKTHNKCAIETLGEKGSQIFVGDSVCRIAAIYTEFVIDATGCGDAFRAGLLYGLSKGWTVEKSCKLGSVIAGIKIKYNGGQNHSLKKEEIDLLGEKEFGEKFFEY